ncbi:MAG: HPr family phosphocarrier protein [Halothiobacillaceae bacterium]|nr:MAG: HPr family phosphocarrier protein [Halothiobacillaceae bacterium]
MELECAIEIVNKRGLHARAAARFASLAASFSSTIRVQRDAMQANGKSIMGLMMLAAPVGSHLQIRADGEDARAAIDALKALIDDRFGEGE